MSVCSRCSEAKSGTRWPRLALRSMRLRLGEMWNLRPLAACLAADRRARKLGVTRINREVMLERVPGTFYVACRRLLVFVQHIVADQMARDAELHITIDELVVCDIDLRDQCLEPIL